MSEIKAIETRYAGCRFRSRLEARFAVFFDHAGVAWEYEPQGFVIDGRPYLPDFLLTACGTWVEVKGSDAELDKPLMEAAAEQLPLVGVVRERGPRLLILGPIPVPPIETADLGWLGLTGHPDNGTHGAYVNSGWYGFGSYGKNLRPWRLVNTSSATPVEMGDDRSWLTPAVDDYESGIPGAYIAARSARFEHGERG